MRVSMTPMIHAEAASRAPMSVLSVRTTFSKPMIVFRV